MWPANTQQATCSSGGYERLPSSLHVSPRRRIRVGEEGTVLVIVRRNGQNGRVDPTGDRAGRQTLALLPAVHRLVGRSAAGWRPHGCPAPQRVKHVLRPS